MTTEINIYGVSDECFETFAKENWMIMTARVAWNECRTRALAQIEYLERVNKKLTEQLKAAESEAALLRVQLNAERYKKIQAQ